MKKPLFYNQPMEDELINSYFMRLLILNGINDFSGIIHKYGWRENPSMPEAYQYLFRGIEHSALLKLYEWNFVSENIFDIDKNYIKSKYRTDSFHDTFFLKEKDIVNEHRKFRRTFKVKDVRYCSECIKEQIYYYGFAYFRVDWSFEHICSRHQLKLFTLNKELKPNQALQEIKNILSSAPVENVESDEKYANKYKPAKKTDFAITPCATSLIYLWAFKNKNIIHKYKGEDYSNLLKDSENDFYKKYSIAYQCNFYLSQLYQEELMLGDYDSFLSMLKKYMTIAPVKYTNNNVFLTKSNIIKCNIKSCNDCSTYYCKFNKNNAKGIKKSDLDAVTYCLVCNDIPKLKYEYSKIDRFETCSKCYKENERLNRKITKKQRNISRIPA